MHLSSFKYALMTPKGNNFFEFNLKAFRICPGTLAGKTILDVGASNLSLFGRHATRLGATVVSLDPQYYDLRTGFDLDVVHEIISVGAPEIGIPEVELLPIRSNVAAIAQEIPFADNSFDMVVSFACVPQYIPVDDYSKVLHEMLRVTKQGGSIHLAPVNTSDELYPHGHGVYTSPCYELYEAGAFTSALLGLDVETAFHPYEFEEHGDFDQRGLIITKPIS